MRSVEETKPFAASKKEVIKELGIDDKVFDEAFLFPIQNLVCLKPDIYQNIEGTNFWFVATTETAGFPSLHVIYEFDDEKIYLNYVAVNRLIED